MGLTVITPPDEWPVSLEEAKRSLRILNTAEDVFIQDLIEDAVTHIERTLSLSLAERTLLLTLPGFSSPMALAGGPVRSITSIAYKDENGVDQTLPASTYQVDLAVDHPKITLKDGESWPQTLTTPGAVAITYTAGFDELPRDLRRAALLLVGHWFYHREAASDRNVQAIDLALDDLLQPFRLVRI